MSSVALAQGEFEAKVLKIEGSVTYTKTADKVPKAESFILLVKYEATGKRPANGTGELHVSGFIKLHVEADIVCTGKGGTTSFHQKGTVTVKIGLERIHELQATPPAEPFADGWALELSGLTDRAAGAFGQQLSTPNSTCTAGNLKIDVSSDVFEITVEAIPVGSIRGGPVISRKGDKMVAKVKGEGPPKQSTAVFTGGFEMPKK